MRTARTATRSENQPPKLEFVVFLKFNDTSFNTRLNKWVNRLLTPDSDFNNYTHVVVIQQGNVEDFVKNTVWLFDNHNGAKDIPVLTSHDNVNSAINYLLSCYVGTNKETIIETVSVHSYHGNTNMLSVHKPVRADFFTWFRYRFGLGKQMPKVCTHNARRVLERVTEAPIVPTVTVAELFDIATELH